MSRRTSLTLGLGVALLLGISCRDSNEGPTDPGSTEAGATLALASTPLAFFQLDAGLSHTCGITTDNRAYCWGHNKNENGAIVYGSGQLGDGTTMDRHQPVPVIGGLFFRQVSAG